MYVVIVYKIYESFFSKPEVKKTRSIYDVFSQHTHLQNASALVAKEIDPKSSGE